MTLTATPDAGYAARWEGDCAGSTGATCTLRINGDRAASVSFVVLRTLTVVAGLGGSVEPAPGAHSYPDGARVTLTATAGAGYLVGAWGGDCTGSAATCELTVDADKTASVSFAALRTLTVEAGPNGGVEPAPGAHSYPDGARVTLTATPGLGYVVDAWGGDCAGGAATCELTVDADKTASVRFAPDPAVTCESGTAVRNPAQNAALVRDCKVLLGLKDELAGTAALNWSAARVIDQWDGVRIGWFPLRVSRLNLNSRGLDGVIPAELADVGRLFRLSLSNNRLTGSIPPELGRLTELDSLYLGHNRLTGPVPPELGAISGLRWLTVGGNSLSGCLAAGLHDIPNHDLRSLGLADCAASYTLTTSAGPNGAVAPAPGAHSYAPWTSVTLTATADAGYRVAAWSGACSGNAPTCVLRIAGDVTAGVTFERVMHTLNITAGPNGSVDPAPGAHSYEPGARVTLTASPASGYRVVAWSGDCAAAVAAATCELTMDAPRSAGVTFAPTAGTVACMGGVAVQHPAAYRGLATDCATLLDLKDQLRGRGALDWSAEKPIVQWEGVTVGGTPPRVTALSLATRGLDGRLPLALGKLTALTSLDLTWNKLGGAIPAELGNLAELRDLALYRNSLSGSIPPELGNLANLESLSLSQNFLSGSIPPELGQLAKLQALHLYQNRLSGRIPFELANLRELTALYLAGNGVAGCIPHGLRDVANNDLDCYSNADCSLWRVCGTGIPVPDPAANPRLLEDCEALLAWRGTLAGTATLNWSAGRAMTSWTGVTVAGTPRRVTKLELANAGLTGEISGLVGELEGLVELRLNGNALTGRIPSKVAMLTDLTHVYLGGNALTGCVPSSLRAVANNDLASLGLADCGAIPEIPYERFSVLTAGTYRAIWNEGDSALVFEVPRGLQLEVYGWAWEHRGEVGLLLRVVGSKAFIGIHVYEGVEWGRARPAEDADRLDPLFDRVVESAWVDRREPAGK